MIKFHWYPGSGRSDPFQISYSGPIDKLEGIQKCQVIPIPEFFK
jgi:hypothetical protein